MTLTSIVNAVWNTARQIGLHISAVHRRGNQHFARRFSDMQFTAVSLGVILFCTVIMLWVPSYLGVGNDGTITRTMQNAGLSYTEQDAEGGSDYFTRIYQTHYTGTDDRSFQLLLIRLAQTIDDAVTGDGLFDVRFLSIIYVILALPAWGLLIYSVVSRASAFIEKCVLSGLCVLVLADVSCITYFNSLYPEAVYIIGLSYLFGGCMMLQRSSRFTPLYWLALIGGAIMLCSTRRHAAIIGFIAALFCITQLRINKSLLRRAGIMLAAAAVLTAGFYSLTFVESDFDDTSRVHAMTRGVLLQSSNPEKTLQEFGIDGSYALLADVSLYDQYSLTDESEYFLQNGFLDRCTAADITIHYLRHPGALLSMLDLGVKSSANLRRGSCGNYERSSGMPAGGKSVFCAIYSIVKSRALPQTIAFPFLLVIVCAVMARGGLRRQKEPDRFYYVYFCTVMTAAAVLILHLAAVIIASGDAQLTQYSFIAGFSLDCLVLFTLSELLHKLNILEDAQEPDKS